MVSINGKTIPVAVLDTILDLARAGKKAAFTYEQVRDPILDANKEKRPPPTQDEQDALGAAILAYWNVLLRSGTINFGTAEQAWETGVFQLSDVGREALKHLEQDPINPDGYMLYLKNRVTLNPVSESYVLEAIKTYMAGCHKATAVMIGTAAEGMLLSLREVLVNKLRTANPTREPEKGIEDWRIKIVCDALEKELDKWKGKMGPELAAAYATYWHSFTAHIRAIRNASGHPNSIDPVTPMTVHAALLAFPDFAGLAVALESWAAKADF